MGWDLWVGEGEQGGEEEVELLYNEELYRREWQGFGLDSDLDMFGH
jgi:hypothetical protein